MKVSTNRQPADVLTNQKCQNHPDEIHVAAKAGGGSDQMTIETGVLSAMAIGIIGAAILTGWCLYSRYQEKQNAE